MGDMKMKKRLPIGIDDFKKIIEEEYYYIDNTMLIQELKNDGAAVTLLTRPRRFGKTLTLSMIKSFYDIREETLNLFKGLKIEREEVYHEKNSYPVLFFSMKELKDLAWETTYSKIQMLMQRLYLEYEIIETVLLEEEKEYCKKIKAKKADQAELEMSLYTLTQFLERYYKRKVIILIDEYDTPIISGYSSEYYKEVIQFMRNYLAAALKTNTSLKFALLTGITRVSKESIFSGLNHLQLSTVINGLYGNRIGFVEEQVQAMLRYYDLEDKMQQARNWYNGYVFGKHRVYNPWSILNFVSQRGNPRAYWVNTSSEDLIKNLLRKNLDYVKDQLSKLVRNETIKVKIEDTIDYNVLETDKDNIWSLFVQSGYLNIIEEKTVVLEEGLYPATERIHVISIPNNEIKSLYHHIIKAWLNEGIGSSMVERMLKELTAGDLESFEMMFIDIVERYFSYYDVAENKGEEFYHAFSLGLLIHLLGKYDVKSNVESGYGRSDLLLIPKDKTKRGIIIEIKRINKNKEKDLEQTAQDALEQIEKKKYHVELEKEGVREIIKMGIGFRGKECKVLWK